MVIKRKESRVLWNQNFRKKNVSNAQLNVDGADLATAIPHQLQEMLKLGPSSNISAVKRSDDTDEELEYHFVGMISCHFVKNINDAWIIDSGASDHMIANLE